MATHLIEPEGLLETAERLAPTGPEAQRATFSDNRRAVSTAYYAVFHAIAARVAETAFPHADGTFLRKVQRWITHSDIRIVAHWFGQVGAATPGNPPPHVLALLQPNSASSHVDVDALAIALGFLQLNAARQRADYDYDSVFKRADARAALELAETVVETVEKTQTDSARRFFGLVAMRSSIQPR